MAELKLQESAPFEGCDLPLALGSARLETVSMGEITAVMPFKGQAMSVAKALKSVLGTSLPMVGEVTQAKDAELLWFGPGQWLVFSNKPDQIKDALQGLAAVVDQSDGWLGLVLSGKDAGAMMARLCPLDFDGLAVGQVARTDFCHVSTMIIPVEDGCRIMVPRSYAVSVYENILMTMKSLAAQNLLG
ncbi:MAG: hypothetical protein L3J33_03030 [Rhodobacteraceae bacterium]|nr:hypothetical protein [Paracoccaceae bacterium]